MTLLSSPPDQRILLRDVSWETYERLLKDLENCSAPRLTYDDGTLEIMSPSPQHERRNRNLAHFVEILAEEIGVDIGNLGSTTYKRYDFLKGFEPDSSFYIQNEALIRGKSQIDLLIDPPPDLVIDIDVSHSCLDKFALFLQIGIPELWIDDEGKVTIYLLQGEKYKKSSTSLAFSGLSSVEISRFLDASLIVRRTEWLRQTRGWIRQQGWAKKP